MAVSILTERQDAAGATLSRGTNGGRTEYSLSMYVPIEIDRGGYPTTTDQLRVLGIEGVRVNRRLDIVMNPHLRPESQTVYTAKNIRDLMGLKQSFFHFPNRLIQRIS